METTFIQFSFIQKSRIKLDLQLFIRKSFLKLQKVLQDLVRWQFQSKLRKSYAKFVRLKLKCIISGFFLKNL